MSKIYSQEGIFEAIKREMEYQDKKWGEISESGDPKPLSHYITVMVNELEEVVHCYCKRDAYDTLREILQVVSVGVACMEEHGVFERDHGEYTAKLKAPNLDNTSRLMNKSLPGSDRYCEVDGCAYFGPVRYSYNGRVLCDYHAGLYSGYGIEVERSY